MQSLYFAGLDAFLRYDNFPGAQPTVVYLAGLGLAASAIFPRVVVEANLAQHRSIIVDLFGCGYSDAPEAFGYALDDHAGIIATLLDHLQVSGACLVAHSMGGSVAIALAALRPALVSKLLLAESNLDAGGGMLSRHIAEQDVHAFLDEGFPRFLQDVRAGYHRGDSGAAIAVGMWQVASPLALHRSAVGLIEGTEPIMREQLYRMTMPRLYVFGDQSLPDKDHEELPRQGVPVVVVPDAGHGMMWDNPGGFARLVSRFVGR